MAYLKTSSTPYGAGDFVDVHAAGAGIEDVFVDTALLVDLLGLAALHHMALLEHVDVVGIDDLADVVRDDDDGAARLDGVDTRLDLFGGDGIETGGGLVEEDDGRVLEKHTGDGDALLLSATELQRLCLKTVG